MKTTITKKEKAIEIMKKMNIYKPYIKDFAEEDKVCFFEMYGGFWIDQEPELYAKMKALEEKYKCKVYAVTHEFTEFGELYDFLIVTDYPEEWDTLVYSQGNRHTAFAYVWNKDDDWCSEFGSVTVQSFGGGIRRIAQRRVISMAKINELKKYLGYEFSTGCYTGDDYKSFQTKYINYLKAMCKENHRQLVNVCRNHYCFSAFVKSYENKCVYISISDVRYFPDGWYNRILIRKAKNESDYRGGFNHYTTLDRLNAKAAELLEDLPF